MDITKQVIAQKMSEKLRKARRISPIQAEDVVKLPDNYNYDAYRKRRVAAYAACVDQLVVTATVWEDGEITVKINWF